MQIDFSKEEYSTFLEILEIATWVLLSHRTDVPKNRKKYQDFEQKIYSYAEAFGFGDLIMYDEELPIARAASTSDLRSSSVNRIRPGSLDLRILFSKRRYSFCRVNSRHHWGEDYPLCDIGPTPFGDGIVDVQDLIVLAEHLFEEIPPVE